ncbi:dockerin type I repeat-containing protein, partial [Patescibacteria group bacterium]|nr:dockerin type I repeat-containing protein [Patescibacteria group bacterium]
SAFVTLTESGAVIGTTSATGDGSFSFPLSGVDPGNHTYGISATDVNNLATAQVQEQLYLLANTATSVTNILLSPTIQLDKATIQPGDTLTISGSARPLSQMSIFTESPLKSYSASTDIQGNWSYTLPSSETQNYAPGQYRAYAIVTDSNGNQSLTSPSVNFLVEQSTSGNNPAPSCDISHGDLNCDGTVNLTDFSILLYWWGTDHKAADINGDGIVNLVDFSIMMYYFQR